MNRELAFAEVAAGIIWKGDKFLAAKRPIGGPRGGFWEFPGGKREDGETIEETLIRELEEELGIKCTDIIHFKNFTYEYTDLRVKLFFMHVLAFENKEVPKLGQDLKWIRPEEASDLEFLPADIKILDGLKRPY